MSENCLVLGCSYTRAISHENQWPYPLLSLQIGRVINLEEFDSLVAVLLCEQLHLVPVTEGQEVSFQGDAVVVKGFGQTTYFVKTENEGFKQLFTESEKDGKKVFNDDLGEPFGEAEAQAFIENLSKEEATKLSDILVKWKTE